MNRVESRLEPDNAPSAATASPLGVCVAGAYKLWRDALAVLMAADTSLRVVADGDDPEEALDGYRGPPPDLVVIDACHGPEQALRMLEGAKRAVPAARVLVVTADADRDLAAQLVLGGVRGIVSAARSGEHFLDAVRKVHAGELWIDRATTAHIIGDLSARRAHPAADSEQQRIALLTPREREVVQLVASGHSNRVIAHRMGISDNTVRHHLTSVFAKLQVADRTSLVVFCFRNKLA